MYVQTHVGAMKAGEGGIARFKHYLTVPEFPLPHIAVDVVLVGWDKAAEHVSMYRHRDFVFVMHEQHVENLPKCILVVIPLCSSVSWSMSEWWHLYRSNFVSMSSWMDKKPLPTR